MRKIVLVCLTLLCVSGCGAVKDAIDEAVNDIASKYIGNYTGTFSSTSGATDKGTFDFVVDNEGKATGAVTSTTFNKTYPVTGSVNSSGNLTATATDSKYKFNGNVNSSGEYTGGWESPASKGSFAGDRNGGSDSSITTSTNGGYTCASSPLQTNSKCPTIQYCVSSTGNSGYYSAGGKTFTTVPSDAASVNSAAQSVVQYCMN